MRHFLRENKVYLAIVAAIIPVIIAIGFEIEATMRLGMAVEGFIAISVMVVTSAICIVTIVRQWTNDDILSISAVAPWLMLFVVWLLMGSFTLT